MPKLPKHRSSIIKTAATLFRRQGYAATGINEIVAVSGAPKGSLYHYFPRGKEQIGEEAVRHAGAFVAETLDRLAHDHNTAASLLVAYGGMLAGWMIQSDFREGCPITTVLLETAADSAPLALAGQAAFNSWRKVFENALLRDGLEPDRASRLAALGIAALEGAMIQARVERSGSPITDAASELARLFSAEVSSVL
jgi:TetR/AcrR family transcriptional repressor of lmrAB and yxaGH operons